MPTIIKNGRNYSGTSVSLTQAEYDALPEVTKMNGTTYFITDSEVVLNAEDVALDEGNLNDLAGSVATIETSPATANHEVGEYILWNGVVYVVTSAIATGENLVINSNISARTIGSELTALNNGLIGLELYRTPYYSGTTSSTQTIISTITLPAGKYFAFPSGYNSLLGAYVTDSNNNPIGEGYGYSLTEFTLEEQTTIKLNPIASASQTWTVYQMNFLKISD